MNYLRRIQRGVDFVEANLDFEFDLRSVSAAAGVSHWHFQRTFKALTGETLMGYVRSRRMARSLELLLDADRRIVEIAVMAGFDSQEAFTRAFRRMFGLTPGEYRKLGSRNRFVRKVRFDEAYLHHLHENVSLEPSMEVRPEMRMVGLPTRFFGVESERNNLSEKLPPLWAAFLPRLEEIEGRAPGACYGVVRPASDASEGLDYLAAVEVDGSCALPLGMTEWLLPPATYATFEHRGDPRALDQTVSYAYGTWLARSGEEPTYGTDLEIYGASWRANAEDSVMHYAVPIAGAASKDG